MTDAYAAGLLDGEGCLTLSKRANGKGYAARMDMGMSAKALAVLTLMQEQYGGTLRQFRPATERWEAAWTWGLFGGACIAFLERVLPHLHLKREQAEVLLSWNRELSGLPTRANGRRILDERAYRISEQSHQRIKALNAKGPAEPARPMGEPWLARLVGGLWVTPQHDLFSESQLTPFSGPWPKSGTMQSGALYARPTWAPRTDASGSSLWPTPKTPTGGANSKREERGAGGPDLQESAQTWATPSVCGNYNRKGASPTSGDGLDTEATAWATPTTRDHKDTGDLSGSAFRADGTPRDDTAPRQAQACAGQTPPPSEEPTEPLGSSPPKPRRRGLNPRFGLWLMGFPVGWLD